MSQNIINTREKIGSLSRRIIQFCFDQKKNEFTFNQILTNMNQYSSDSKKIVEILYILLGIGIITKISKHSFIYSGIEGIEGSFQEFKKNENLNYLHFQEEIKIGDKFQSIKQFLILQQCTQNIIYVLLASSTNSITKSDFEQIFAKYYQKDYNKNIQNDFLNILQSLKLIIKNEESETIIWIDQNKGINSYLINDSVQQNYMISEENRIKKQVKLNEDISTELITIPKEFMPKQQVQTNFPNSGFALLKGKSIRYVQKKLNIIIGKFPQADTNYKWQVDLEIPISKNISKQHAAILYNFHEARFEIKCLSKKFPIMVNKKILTQQDKAVELKNKSVINIGNEQLNFYLPKTENEIKE